MSQKNLHTTEPKWTVELNMKWKPDIGDIGYFSAYPTFLYKVPEEEQWTFNSELKIDLLGFSRTQMNEMIASWIDKYIQAYNKFFMKIDCVNNGTVPKIKSLEDHEDNLVKLKCLKAGVMSCRVEIPWLSSMGKVNRIRNCDTLGKARFIEKLIEKDGEFGQFSIVTHERDWEYYYDIVREF